MNRFAFFMTLALITISCGRGFQSSPGPLDLSSSSDQGNETPAPVIPPDPNEPPPTPPQPFTFEALAWEKVQPDGKNWSTYVFKLLQNEAKAILTAQDMSRFCKKYSFLNESQKINVAGQLIAGIVKWESSFNPTSRFQESTMGTDPVTGLPVWSEGLMQLSYQDTQWAPFCAFNWAADKKLPVDSPKKTILDPYKNLYCGMRILANQITRKGSIVLSTGVYWSVIKENGRYERIDEIAEIVGSLKVCQ
jgi:hypothetical protein